jgi:hypothetical protein
MTIPPNGPTKPATGTRATAPGAIPPPPPAPARTLVRCARHRDVDATFTCSRCRMRWCERCVRTGAERGVAWRLCSCGGRCEPIPVGTAPPPAAQRHELVSCFAYPLQGGGRLQIALGAAVFAFLVWLFASSIAAMMGMVSFHPKSYADAFMTGTGFAGSIGSLLILACLAGYLVAYMEIVIVQTARGGDEPPGFPDFTSVWQSMLAPIVRLGGLAGACFGPGILLLFLLPGLWKIGALALLLAGAAWFPMALLALAILDSADGYDPRRVLAAIRVDPNALAAALFLGSLALLAAGALFITIAPGLSALLTGAIAVYLTVAAGRVLGLTYRHHAREFGWIET